MDRILEYLAKKAYKPSPYSKSYKGFEDSAFKAGYKKAVMEMSLDIKILVEEAKDELAKVGVLTGEDAKKFKEAIIKPKTLTEAERVAFTKNYEALMKKAKL